MFEHEIKAKEMWERKKNIMINIKTVDQTYLAWRIVRILKSNLKIESHICWSCMLVIYSWISVCVWVCNIYLCLYFVCHSVSSKWKEIPTVIGHPEVLHIHFQIIFKPIELSIYSSFLRSIFDIYIYICACAVKMKEIKTLKMWTYFRFANTKILYNDPPNVCKRKENTGTNNVQTNKWRHTLAHTLDKN